ncbi:hypothetical protein [Microcella sp.]|uniref:hypothetical protein n=1 Tax=Microcella sp. TaxID=1913979 RepID=UPI00391B7561
MLGGCPDVRGEVGDGAAIIDGELTNGGGPGSGSGGGGGGASGPPGSVEMPMPCDEVFAGYCYGEGQPKPVDAEPGVPAVTWSDIAIFRPRPPTQFMQPDGWMVVGLPTNFVARTEPHIVSGTLLGAPADVRFTPVGYRWRYGDGSAVRRTTTGATWAALGLREFDATPTSHVYDAPGTYVIELDVEFTAEYRFAGGAWRSLAGVIVLPANDLIATAGDAVTVLVDRDCTEGAVGPGC